MKKLILTIGLPRSGKTTWALMQNGIPIVNPDSIRLAIHRQRYIAEAEPFVWAVAYTMVEALFLAGHDTVIVDATNISEKRRKPWIDRFDKVAEIIEKVFDASPSECIKRALALEDNVIVPIIEKMAKEWDLEKPESWKDI